MANVLHWAVLVMFSRSEFRNKKCSSSSRYQCVRWTIISLLVAELQTARLVSGVIVWSPRVSHPRGVPTCAAPSVLRHARDRRNGHCPTVIRLTGIVRRRTPRSEFLSEVCRSCFPGTSPCAHLCASPFVSPAFVAGRPLMARSRTTVLATGTSGFRPIFSPLRRRGQTFPLCACRCSRGRSCDTPPLARPHAPSPSSAGGRSRH